jgi:glycosyltransferase involved in cell wall biosynthesis
MDKTICVSILITYYNQKKYIADSLKSVLQQKTSFRFEIICGDDGSSDGTYEELLTWQKKYPEIIRVIQMPRDKKKKYDPIIRVSNCRLTLYAQAKGSYVIFLDGDDYFTDCNKIEKQKNILDKNPSCICAAHPINFVWENESQKSVVACNPCEFTRIINKKIYWSYSWIHADTFMFRNIYHKNVEHINSSFFDDNTITVNFIKYGDILFTPDCMVAYRQIEGSSWNMRNPLQKAYVNLYVYSEASKILKGWGIVNWIRSFADFREFYVNRNSDFACLKQNEIDYRLSFIERTMKYRDANSFFKIWYQVRYGLAMHMGFLINIYRKMIKNIINSRTKRIGE